jgi:DNA-binding PadR family transcriptional regulator
MLIFIKRRADFEHCYISRQQLEAVNSILLLNITLKKIGGMIIMTKLNENNPSSLLFRKYVAGEILIPYVLKIINDNDKNPLCVQELVSIIQEKTSKKNPDGDTLFEGFNLNHGLQYTVLEYLESDGLIYGNYKASEDPMINPKALCYWQITTEGTEKLNGIIEDYRHPFTENLYNLTQISKELFE